jgi:hypothetical protein
MSDSPEWPIWTKNQASELVIFNIESPFCLYQPLLLGTFGPDIGYFEAIQTPI